MTSIRRVLLAAAAICTLFTLLMIPAQASTEEDNAKKMLLQAGLTLAQIEEEITRLQDQRQAVEMQIARSEKEEAAQSEQVKKRRDRAGTVLRAYYMGQRKSMWLMLLEAKSFSDLFDLYRNMRIIYETDQQALTTYQDEYNRLKNVRKSLEQENKDLTDLLATYESERTRMGSLQQQIDAKLSQQPGSKEEWQNQIKMMQNLWKQTGQPLFEKYFNAMAGAMQELPNTLLQGGNSKSYFHGTEFRIRDSELTDYFHSQSADLAGITISFTNGTLTADGKENNLEAVVKGHYQIEQKPNRLQFHIDQLEFNGYPLDQTTVSALESDYDLSFSPGDINPMLQATSITTEDGWLRIKFTINP
ncbi:murein hydrolase activator EnvC family protein [Gorillibacterium massiliense]|uniref:murein hydrolase activator EnvC family protein n=1 Tax=Gorillibacterium massiliense TaxID=1280390 RepID=UPI0004B987A6|nr:hypothetical protein [Gorillibacterium massiliense]